MKKASVIRYRPEQNRAPLYLGTGYGHRARQILQIAERYQVPVIQDELLLAQLEKMPPGREIPEELFFVFAEIIAFAWQTKKRLQEKGGNYSE